MALNIKRSATTTLLTVTFYICVLEGYPICIIKAFALTEVDSKCSRQPQGPPLHLFSYKIHIQGINGIQISIIIKSLSTLEIVISFFDLST